MQITALNNKSMESIRDLVSDVLDGSQSLKNTPLNNASFTSGNPINNIEDPAIAIHQTLGNKMTQVNLIV